MRRLALAAVLAVVVAAPLPAHAADVAYRGGCSYATTSNPIGGGALGGRTVWTGVVYLAVVPTTDYPTQVPTGEAVTAWCELRINGVSHGTVLGPVSGQGAVAGAAPIQFEAAETDVVSLCDHVVTTSGTRVDCGDCSCAALVPQPIRDLVDVVGDILDPADAAACAALGGDTSAGPYLLYVCPEGSR